MTTSKDELMMELGYISVFVTNFDHLLHEISSYLISAENIKIGNYIMSTHKNYDAKIKTYKKLLHIVPFSDELVAKAENNVVRFVKTKDKRNELVHSIWHSKDESILDEYYIKNLSSDWSDGRKIDIKELRELKEELIELVQKQFELNKEISENYRTILENNIKEKENTNNLIKKINLEI